MAGPAAVDRARRRLRRQDGICSGVAFPSTGRLIDDALAAVRGVDPETTRGRSRSWPLLEVIDDCAGEPWCAVLAEHLGHGADDHRRGRRWAAAARLAGLFRSYAAHRPQMLRDWADGRDTDGHQPAARGPALAGRAVAAAARAARPQPGRAARRRTAPCCAPSRRCCDLPERVSVFGPTRLPGRRAAGAGRARASTATCTCGCRIPAPRCGSELQGFRAGPPRRGRRRRRRATIRCCAASGRDVRELQLRLPAARRRAPPGRATGRRPCSAACRPTSRDDRRPPGAAGSTTQLQVHACHGPARQVEVLREVLLRPVRGRPDPRAARRPGDVPRRRDVRAADLGRLRARPTEPAAHPAAPAARAAGRPRPAPDQPAARRWRALLDLAGGRVTASQVLDLAGHARRCGAGSASPTTTSSGSRDWVARAGVRWGLDADAPRRPYALDGVRAEHLARPASTGSCWASRPPRTSRVWLGRALPLDDVDSSDIDLAGRFAELLDRLGDRAAATGRRAPASGTGSTRCSARSTLLDRDRRRATAWQLVQARARARRGRRGRGGDEPRAAGRRARAAGRRLPGRPTRANFRTGNLTVCTLVPMRSVPHRVVVLLGLDDGVFPRAARHATATTCWPATRAWGSGTRAARTASCCSTRWCAAERAAGRALHRRRPGQRRRAAARRAAGRAARRRRRVMTAAGRRRRRHPAPAAALRRPLLHRLPPPFSFDPVDLAGARAPGSPASRPRPERRLLRPRTGPVALEDLVAFVEHPAKAYLRQRLRHHAARRGRRAAGRACPPSWTGSQEWAVGERLLAARLRGPAAGDAGRAEWLRGRCPPAPSAARRWSGSAAGAPLVPRPRRCCAVPPRAVDVRLDLGGRELRRHGQRRPRPPRGERRGTPAGAPSTGCAAWVLTLALAAPSGEGTAHDGGPQPGPARTSTLDGAGRRRCSRWRAGRAVRRRAVRAAPAGDEDVCRVRRGSAWAARLPERALASARPGVEPSDSGGDARGQHYQYVWGESAAFEQALAGGTRRRGAVGRRATRFGALACRLWAPIRAAEQVS